MSENDNVNNPIVPPEPPPGTARGATSPPIQRTRRRPPPAIAAESVQRGYGCADVITAGFLLLTILTVVLTILLVSNPASPLNPFPRGTPVILYVMATNPPTPTATRTFTPVPPTATIPTPLPSPLPTKTITPTPTASSTPLVSGPGLVSSGKATIGPIYTRSAFAFTIGSITYTANNSDIKCQYQGIAGTVVDLDGKPIDGLAVYIKGGDNQRVDEFHFTGQSPRFGRSGFEAVLGAQPADESFTLQLRSKNGAPISDAVVVKTRTGCNQNLVIVNFVQNHAY